MSSEFDRLWLQTDTYIDKMTLAQRRQMRALCEKFFNAGRRRDLKEKKQDERVSV